MRIYMLIWTGQWSFRVWWIKGHNWEFGRRI